MSDLENSLILTFDNSNLFLYQNQEQINTNNNQKVYITKLNQNFFQSYEFKRQQPVTIDLQTSTIIKPLLALKSCLTKMYLTLFKLKDLAMSANIVNSGYLQIISIVDEEVFEIEKQVQLLETQDLTSIVSLVSKSSPQEQMNKLLVLSYENAKFMKDVKVESVCMQLGKNVIQIESNGNEQQQIELQKCILIDYNLHYLTASFGIPNISLIIDGICLQKYWVLCYKCQKNLEFYISSCDIENKIAQLVCKIDDVEYNCALNFIIGIKDFSSSQSQGIQLAWVQQEQQEQFQQQSIQYQMQSSERINSEQIQEKRIKIEPENQLKQNKKMLDVKIPDIIKLSK